MSLHLQTEPYEDGGVVLPLLIEQPSVRFSEDELASETGWPPERVADVLADLQRAGLAHRQDGFAWASRAAVRCHELLV
jgi:hypothetical protein